MIRFVVRHSFKDQHSGAEGSSLYTIDGDVAALESNLRRGGFSETGYDMHELIGCELIDDTKKDSQP